MARRSESPGQWRACRALQMGPPARPHRTGWRRERQGVGVGFQFPEIIIRRSLFPEDEPSPGGWRAGWRPQGLENWSARVCPCTCVDRALPVTLHTAMGTTAPGRVCGCVCTCVAVQGCVNVCASACVQTSVPVGVSVHVRAMVCKCVQSGVV